MKLVTTTKQLRDALSVVTPVIERRNTYPVLECVLFDGRKLTATNLDQIITVDFAAKRASGKAAIVTGSLSRILAHVPADQEITISASAGTAVLDCGHGRYELTSLDPDGYPDMAWHNADPEHGPVDDIALKTAIEYVRPAISTDEFRYFLNGISFSLDELGRDVLVATNGYVLATHLVSTHGLDWLQGTIVPDRAVDALRRLPDCPKISLVNRGHIRFDWPGIRLSSKLIDGTYPDWKRVVPKSETDHPSIELDVKATRAALRRLSGLWPNRGSQHFVTLAFNERGLAMVAKNYDCGSGHEVLDHHGVTAAGSACIDMRFMQIALRQFHGAEKVRLSFKSENDPGRLTAENHDGFLLVMPARSNHMETAANVLAAAYPERLEVAA